MSLFAVDVVRQAAQSVRTAVSGIFANRVVPVRVRWAAAVATAASTTAVHAAASGYTTGTYTISTAITNPNTPRCLTATAGGTAGDIKAVSVVVHGTNYNDEVISETLPAFTVDSAGTVQGSKAFKTVTSYDVPAMDGAGASVAIGVNEKLGLPFELARNTVWMAFLDGVKEGTLPTVTVDDDEIEKNTVDLNSALAGTAVDVYFIVG